MRREHRIVGLSRVVATASLLLLVAGALPAQTLTMSGGWLLSVPALTEPDYDATVSGPTETVSISATCPTGGGPTGCSLLASYGGNPQGQPLTLEVQVIGASPDCDNAALGTWRDVSAGPILTTGKKADCSATLMFRVANLSYAAYPFPGRLGTSSPYEQDLVLTFIRDPR